MEITTDWKSHLEKLPQSYRDVYFTPEYVRLCAAADQRAESFVYTCGEHTMLLPMLRSELQSGDVRLYDFETPYGYGGPIYSTDNEEFRLEALAAMRHYFHDRDIMAGFVRFHPLLQNHRLFDTVGSEHFDRHTAAINLVGTEQEIWLREIHSKNRTAINKGGRCGLRFEADHEYLHLERFIQLYTDTMQRLGADEFYYFSAEYFNNFITAMRPYSFLGCVWLDDTIISSAIFMYQGPYGHYHLSGSDHDALRLAPNNFMLWHAALELKRLGVRLFHLGGGTDGNPDNQLLAFKKRFAGDIYDFHIGGVIPMPDAYAEVCNRWEHENPEKCSKYGNRLLKYRF